MIFCFGIGISKIASGHKQSQINFAEILVMRQRI